MWLYEIVNIFLKEVNILKTALKFLSIILSILMIIQSIPVSSTAIENIFENEIYDDVVEEETELPETEILYEITDDRTLNTKAFMQSDGTRLIAQYENAIHYANADGDLIDYDNTLTETQGELNETEYKTTSSDTDIRISKKSNGSKLVRVEKDNYTLSWNFEGISKTTGEVTEKASDDDKVTLDNFSSEITFSEVFTDTDIQYLIYGDSLKENIILNTKDAPDEFTVVY